MAVIDARVACPQCGDDTDEVSTKRWGDKTDTPADGTQATWITTLSCGCKVRQVMTYFDDLGWV